MVIFIIEFEFKFIKKRFSDELRDFAISPGGLVDDEFRAVIWPVLSANLVQNDDLDDVSSSYDSDFESAQSDFDEEPAYEVFTLNINFFKYEI